MKLKANMDVPAPSYSVGHTTTAAGAQLPFRCQTVGRYWAGPAYFTDRSELPTYFAGYCVAGTGIMRYRGAELLIRPGDAFFISCQEQQYYGTVESPWEFRWTHFNGGGCESLFRIFAGRPVVLPEAAGEMEATFDRIESLMRESSLNSDLLLSDLLGSLLSSLCRLQLSRSGLPATGVEHGGVAVAMDYIQTHYNEALTVERLAASVHMSKYYFIRLFKQQIGCTPYQFVIQKRLEEAKRLLKNSACSVEEIAFRVGYQNAGTLIRDFRKNTGLTPGNYRLLEGIEPPWGH